MPGPGPHMMYTLGTGQALSRISNGRFSPHHCIIYSINAFFGPDMGSFSLWLTSTLGFGASYGSTIEDFIHHPFYYFLFLGYPLSFFYSWASRFLLHKGFLDSISGVPLTKKQCFLLIAAGSLSHFFLDHLFEVPLTKRQCFLLIAAGSLSHFFLDHLFEENGHSSVYTWILSTGWWTSRAPVNPDSVVVVGFLCTCLIVGFIYINRVKSLKQFTKQSNQSVRLIIIVAGMYGLWCWSQIYFVVPRRAAVGEEADLGVLVFLGIYFFLPHWLCIMSMNEKDIDMEKQLPH